MLPGQDPALRFLAGGGELGALIRAQDWAATPLGPAHAWPQSLKTAVGIMLMSRQPIWIGWGSALTFLYNDAYQSIIGGKHPWALGRPTAEVWSEIWSEIGPLLATAMGGIEGTYVEEQLLVMERNGYPEETYYTFSYSPIPGDDGEPGGIICANSEDTHRVIGDRQLALLRDLAAETVVARSWREACERSMGALARDPYDITFALLYLLEPGQEIAECAGTIGLAPGSALAPDRIGLGEDDPWPIGAVMREGEIRLLGRRDADGLTDAGGVWERPTRQAALLPLPASSDTGRGGVLIVGLNPYRLFDADYRSFLGLVTGQIAAAIASADAYEEERRRAEALAELDRAKTAFFSNVSHEFRTPLTLMLGPLEEVLSGEPLPETVRTQVALAYRNGIRLLRLVNSLLDFSRIEAGRVQAVYEPVDLCHFTGEIASSFRSALERAGLSLEIRCDPASLIAFVDREMWEKIVLNLLSNAFKFTMTGGITVTVQAVAEPRCARVSVADTGIGIPATELPKLFERFYRVAGAQGRSFEGSGIGLALVQELVRLHGAEIAVESEVGRGTTFAITLPLGQAHLPAAQVRETGDGTRAATWAQAYLEEALQWLPETASGLEAAGELATADLGAMAADGTARTDVGKHILLADDNADMRAYVARLLENQGYRVTAVGDGEAALAAARRSPPDMLLTDVMMPKLDGFGLLRAIRQDPATAGVPVIMLSARAGEEAKVEGLDAGADDYLVKPFAARELLARINANIRMADVRREASRAIWASEQRFRITQDRLSIALSTGGVGVFEWEIDADKVAVLGPIAEIYGVDRQRAEAAGLPLAPFLAGIHAEDRGRVKEAIAQAIAEGTPYRAEYRVIGSGQERIVLAQGKPSEMPGGSKRLAGVIIDVTGQRHVERQLQALNDHLEQRVAEEVAERAVAEEALRQAQKMEAVGQLTGGVAHDFNNLLTIIRSSVEFLRRPDLDEERRRRYLDAVSNTIDRAAKLTGQLLAFARRQALKPEVFDVGDRLDSISDMLDSVTGARIRVVTELPEAPCFVRADASQFETALVNMAVNARDAMDGEGTLTLRLEAGGPMPPIRGHAGAAGPFIAVSVIDTGSGIAPGNLARIFEPFFTTKEVGKGTGLGLSQVIGFAKQSGGDVSVQSAVGEGTAFTLYLPQAPAPAAEAAPRIEEAGPGEETGLCILVVEDNLEVGRFCTQILEDLGHTPVWAENAEAALAEWQKDLDRFDAVFSDVVMPGMGGIELARFIRARQPALPVVLTSGYSHVLAQDDTHGFELLRKPYSAEELARVIRTTVRKRRQRRGRPAF